MHYNILQLIKDLEDCNPDRDWTSKEGLMPVAARTLKRILVCRREYGKDKLGNPLFCHNKAVEAAMECFFKTEGAIFVNGRPVEDFGIGTGAMASAIQAYLDKIADGDV